MRRQRVTGEWCFLCLTPGEVQTAHPLGNADDADKSQMALKKER